MQSKATNITWRECNLFANTLTAESRSKIEDTDIYGFMIYLDLFGGKLENCTEELKLPSDVEENRATPGIATSACRAFVRRKLPRSAENWKIGRRAQCNYNET